MAAYQPGPVYNPPQQQIVTVSSANPNIQAHYDSIGSRRTGWIQLVCGSICVLLGIVAIFIRCYMSGGYFPIWSGLLFFITPGIAGILAAKSRTSCAITTYMVLCIFASLFSFCLVWVMLSSAVVDSIPHDCQTVQDCSEFDLWGNSQCNVKQECTHEKGYEACVAIDVILLFTALVEFIVSIISAAICCRGVCCKGSSKSTSYATVSQNVPAGVVVMQGGGQGSYTVAPSAPQHFPSVHGGYPPAAASYPPPADPAYPPVTGEKPPYPEATAPSAPALDQPPTYEQSVGS
ncbi:uncharacterized protein [Amphiura filiformis]|uniref:uncharacterized protein isoform X1 n=1 Tax=Amphiura filiformis TaxID=82378 RepID=UPI003B20C9D1